MPNLKKKNHAVIVPITAITPKINIDTTYYSMYLPLCIYRKNLLTAAMEVTAARFYLQ